MPRLPRRTSGPLALLAAGALAAAGCVHTAARASLVLVRAGGVSVGSPSFGYLLHPARIGLRGPGFELFRTPSEGGQTYGTARLVDAIGRAAAAVQRRVPGGVPLRVGDLSARTGGRIPHHASHRTGRDVDLLFYALDAAGASVPAPGFVRYNAAGASLDPAQPLTFDTARNWHLVEALARDTDAAVLRIFCAEPLRALLIAYARAHGRDPEMVSRAETLLRQPGDAAPHDDHFHVRVACAPDDRAQGCRDGAPIWWWLEKAWAKSDSLPADDDTLLAALADLEPEPVEDPALAMSLADEAPVEPVERAPAPRDIDADVVVAVFAPAAPRCLPTLADLRAPAYHSEPRPTPEWDALAPGPVCSR